MNDAQIDAMLAGMERSLVPQDSPLTAWQKLGKTWPAQMAQNMLSAVQAPGDAAANKFTRAPQTPGMWSDEDEAAQQAMDRTRMERVTDLAGAVMGGSYAVAPALKNASGMGIRAYHGSPHDFDKFSTSKIGTGEGAQAYGHGLYFAENEGVAKAYREALAPRGGVIDIADALVRQSGGDWQRAAEKFQADLARRQDFAHGAGLKYAHSESDLALLEQLQRGKPGRMYEVNINAKPEQFLDWDKVGSQMPDDILHREAKRFYGTSDINSGAEKFVANRALTDPRIVSEMSERGIPGIKYLDQGSRASGGGSRNYVVFDDSLVNILRKYGIAGGSALGAVSAAKDAEAKAFAAALESSLANMAP